MRRFWLGLWLYWAVWLTLFSVGAGALLAAAVTLLSYFLKGAPALDLEILAALGEIAFFWFGLTWSLALLVALFLVIRRLFYRCIDHHQLTLQNCSGRESMNKAGTEHTLRLWRKWLMAIIWATAAQIIVVITVRYALGTEDLLSWFSVYWLYLFVLISGLMTLPLMEARCKVVKVQKC